MNPSAPSWELYGTFLAVMRTGSLSSAARSLNATQPTVRRHIELLEEALGVVLFTRSPKGLTPTDAAVRAVPYAESMSAMANALVRATTDDPSNGAGTVRLTCSEVVGTEVLPEILFGLRTEHPEIELEIVPTNRNESLLQRDADVAVRMVRPTQNALVAQRIGNIIVGLFASKRYLATHSPPQSIEDLLKSHSLVGADRDPLQRRALEAFGLGALRERFVYRTDSDLAQLAAVRAGIGIGLCQLQLAGPDLQRVVPTVGFPMEMWVVTHEDLQSVPRVRKVFDHLVRALRKITAEATD